MTEQDFANAAALLRCDVAAIKAVADVESSGDGFLKDGRLRVLFEGHVFHKYTRGLYASTHPTLCHPKWTRANYCKGNPEQRGAGELARFEAAKALDPEAAMMSCSIGRFQVMGFNFKACGYPSVQAMWSALAVDEAAHLMAFCQFVIASKLDGALRNHQWVTFARGYNGPGYATNRYDAKLKEAHKRYV